MRPALDRLLAIPCALLPKRYWQSFDLPMANMATVSAFLALFLGFGLGIRGYFAYLERSRIESKGVSILEVSEAQLQGKLPESAESAAIPGALAMMAPLAFVLFTPLGLFSSYLVISSIARLAAAYTGEPFGDPMLTGVDALAGRTFTERQRRKTAVAREKLEKIDEPDRRYAGEWAGLSGVDFVIVSARRKAGWTKGTWVITDDAWFVLGEPFDRPMPNGLRTIYPLSAQNTLEPVRKSVQYRLPPLRKDQR
jgi:hypothetical protein